MVPIIIDFGISEITWTDALLNYECVRIAKKCMPNKEIKRVCRIFTLADQHKVVWFAKWKRHMPASVLQHMSARMLRDEIKNHNVYTYKLKGMI